MAGRLIGVTSPPIVADAQVHGGARARINILTATAGTARWLSEYVTGAVAADNEKCAPYTAAGIGPGHDHSGGFLGRPLQHTIMACTFGGLAYAYTNTENGFGIRSSVDSGTPSHTVLGITRLLFNGNNKTILIPACGPGGCYFGADFVATVNSDAACDLVIVVTPEVGPPLTYTTRLASGINHCIAANNGRVALVPGKRNNIAVKMTLEYVAATAVVTLLSYGMHQTKNTA